MAKIVIIEDDLDIRELVLYSLTSNQLEGVGFDSGQAFFNSGLKSGDVSLFLLDVMLPDDDGLSILKRLRSDANFEATPIIMLTARSSEMDKVKALDLGADDYIVKPFGILELISRINARLRRQQPKSIVSYGPIHIDTHKYQVHVNEQVVELPNKEYELLLYLTSNAEMVIAREILFEKIWGYDFEGESRTLDIHMSNLRKNLRDAAKYLITVRGVGFKLRDPDA